MPTIDENIKKWNNEYDWNKQGEEWSSGWGGSEAEWYFSVYPRIHRFLPSNHILEIATGFGRWTNYLRRYCEFLTGVDLSEKCINACKERFSLYHDMFFYVNDGKSLDVVGDGSINFVFSFDSLVHADADALESYVAELSRVMTPNAVGFIHHSNLGAYQKPYNFRVPWRSENMTAELFVEFCDKSNLRCIGQEKINWGTNHELMDCISIFTPQGSRWDCKNVVLENPGYMDEMQAIKRLAPLYNFRNVR